MLHGFYYSSHVSGYLDHMNSMLQTSCIEVFKFLLIIEYHCDFFSWWQHASNLASYEQQDAHEFFISILDHIHENIKDDQQKSHAQGTLLFCYFQDKRPLHMLPTEICIKWLHMMFCF